MKNACLRVMAAIGISLTLSCGGGDGDGGTGPNPPQATPVASVTVSPSSATIPVGGTTTLVATPLDASNNPLSGRTVTWASSDQAVATVSSAGVVSGVAAGLATVTATSEGRSGSAQVTVVVPVASVTVTPGTATVLVGGTTTLTATVRDAANNLLTGRPVTWTSTVPSVATVSPAGLVTGVAAGGPVTITATCEGQNGTAQVTVMAPVATVTVSPAASSIVVGHTATLTATLRDAANKVLTDRTIAWTSGNTAVATVSPAGVVTALSVGGPVVITATSEGQSGTALVTVVVPVASVTLNGSARIKVGDTYQYTATARAADGTPIFRDMSWRVAEPTMASMTSTGELTPLQAGPITIVVTIDGDDWVAPAIAYDWESFGSGNVFGAFLPADAQITTQWGASEYPTLALGCSLGFFLVFVDTDDFITENGAVTYAFDSQSPETAVWEEVDDWSALAHPGPQSATYAFSARIAQARKFWFAFTEFNASARSTVFRVTGLAPRLPAFATCPSAGPAVLPLASLDAVSAVQALIQHPSAFTAERALRAEWRAAVARAPELQRVAPVPTSLEAHRLPR